MAVVKKQIAVNSTDWTPIAPEQSGNSICLRNATEVVLRLRTIAGDPSTEDMLPAGNQEVYNLSPTTGGPAYRFQAGVPILYARLASGAGIVLLTVI